MLVIAAACSRLGTPPPSHPVVSDSVPAQIEALSAQLEALEAASSALDGDPEVRGSVMRVARSLQSAAETRGLTEIAAGAIAIQRAADAHLQRSVQNFLARVNELREQSPVDPVTVLIVEDNRTVASATIAYLDAPGRKLVVAPDATTALSLMETTSVDVVVLDLILPDRDGRDVLIQMREQLSTSTIPVIVLSSTATAVARAECMAVGADEFIEKPADPEELRAAVTRQIKSGRRRRDAVRDGLTGLPNRVGIAQEFDQQQRIARREKKSLCVALVALDSLAEVTMKLGRDAGDQLLLEVCATVHEAVGKGNRVGRWQTAELVIVLPDSSLEEARRSLDGALREVTQGEALADLKAAGIDVALSGGVASIDPSFTLHEAVSAAEGSLYRARSSDKEKVSSELDADPARTNRILLLEDDRVTSTLVNHRLVREGLEVVSFGDGSEAFAWLSDADFDLAILDVKVPGMDGFEVLSRIRESPRHKGIPIIMLTGMGSETDVIRGLELGANDYVLKPFSPAELLARVRRLLHRRHVGDGATPPAISSTSEREAQA